MNKDTFKNSYLSEEEIQTVIIDGLKDFGKLTLSKSSKNKTCFGALKNYSKSEIQAFLRDLSHERILSVSKYRGNNVVHLNKETTCEANIEPVYAFRFGIWQMV